MSTDLFDNLMFPLGVLAFVFIFVKLSKIEDGALFYAFCRVTCKVQQFVSLSPAEKE